MLRSLFTKIAPELVRREARSTTRPVTEHERRLVEICAATPEAALARMGVPEKGLSPELIERRRQEFGHNELDARQKAGAVADLLQRFRNPLVVQLLVIVLVALAMGDVRSAVVVGGMILISVGLSYAQETRSSRAVEKLRQLVQTQSIVRRDGREQIVPMSELVPGDIVVLNAGTMIPADLRLITAKDFYVSQSALTGESLPVEKSAAPAEASGGSTMEMPCACFQGSNVLSGSALGLVVNTGANTYFGVISQRLASAQTETSFDKGIKGFTWLMVRFMVVLTAAVFLIIGFTKGNWGEALLFGLAVAVGLTPEMLPMIVTLNLSKGAMTMSRKKVIVKRLSSIQNFGAIDILCTDKTGTLTQDRVVLEKHVDVTGRPSEDVLRYAYMNSYYQTGLRNLLDRAILAHSELEVERTCRKVDEVPFDFNRRRMSVVIEYEDAHVLICKGAVEEMYKACSHYQVDEEIHPLIEVIRTDLMEECAALSAEGYRVLAIAYREFPRSKSTFAAADERDLILLGYIAFYDPPKESALQAVALLKQAGVGVKILTGDNALVTRKVCRDVGIEVDRIVTGDELPGLSEDAIADLAESGNVFARLSPSQKEEIIEALRRRGHVVGYLGDGINDAPSLKAADVGISVDSAADVAKEAADIVLLEKSLLVLEDGIVEGRRVFANIVKYIRMGASSNFGNMFSVVGASYFLPFLPMAPIQILVNNLLYDLSQIGIPTDRVDEELLKKPRRWNIGSIKRFMMIIGPMSSIFDYATFGLMLFFFHCREYVNPATTDTMKAYYVRLFHTGWFVESLLTQTLIVHIIRSRQIPLFQSRPSTGLLLSTLLVMGAGAWLPYSPFATFLGFTPLPTVYWIWIGAFLAAYATLTHLAKAWFHRVYGVE